jgi:archaellum component FlaD/FlaE
MRTKVDSILEYIVPPLTLIVVLIALSYLTKGVGLVKTNDVIDRYEKVVK